MPVNGKKGNHIMGDGKGVLKLKKKKTHKKPNLFIFITWKQNGIAGLEVLNQTMTGCH